MSHVVAFVLFTLPVDTKKKRTAIGVCGTEVDTKKGNTALIPPPVPCVVFAFLASVCVVLCTRFYFMDPRRVSFGKKMRAIVPNTFFILHVGRPFDPF